MVEMARYFPEYIKHKIYQLCQLCYILISAKWTSLALSDTGLYKQAVIRIMTFLSTSNVLP